MRFAAIENYVVDEPGDRVFGVHPDIYVDPDIFELEMRHLFNRTWAFLTIETEIPRPHDFVTTWIGRTPILVSRDRDGGIRAHLNVCRHKGVLLAGAEKGNAKVHVCPYHAWCYDSSGANVGIKDRASGDYPAWFDGADHDLVPLPNIGIYRGLIFGSLAPRIEPLGAFLGDMRFFLDLAMEQGSRGMEFVPGRTTYTYRANWKLQMENGLDSYHLGAAHQSFLQVMSRRRRGHGSRETRHVNWDARRAQQNGHYGFANGHALIWYDEGDVESRANYWMRDDYVERLGQAKADWMLRGKIYHIFPNLQIQDAVTLMVRTFRPIAIDRTEMRTYCLAPIGEPDAMRTARVRRFEDFFNPGGLATPDDAVIYEECQRGFAAEGLGTLQGYARGAKGLRSGGDAMADAIGIRPAYSATSHDEVYSEVVVVEPFRAWRRALADGMAEAGAEGIA